MSGTLTKEMIRPRLMSVFRDVFDDPDLELHDETTAADVEDWDSLAHITLVVSIESEFKVRVSAAEVGRLLNVGQMIAFLEERATP